MLNFRTVTQSPDSKSVNFHSPVWWAKWGRISMSLAMAIRPSGKAMLVISLPRSGSSWIGGLLGSASNALYLREPLSRSYLESGGNVTVFDVDPTSPPDNYALFAARAFTGLPIFPHGVLQDPAQASLHARPKKRLVLKEVNPLALPWLLDAFQPRVLFLVRHPAAVARSYWDLEWRNVEDRLSQFSPRLMDGPLRPWQDTISSASGFWKAHGVFQGAVLRVVMDRLATYKDHKIITYEDICSDLTGNLRNLFQFAELDLDEATKKRIADSNPSSNQTPQNPYSTRRNSQAMKYAWKRKLDSEQLALLHAGYASFKLPFYDSTDDWTV